MCAETDHIVSTHNQYIQHGKKIISVSTNWLNWATLMQAIDTLCVHTCYTVEKRYLHLCSFCLSQLICFKTLSIHIHNFLSHLKESFCIVKHSYLNLDTSIIIKISHFCKKKLGLIILQLLYTLLYILTYFSVQLLLWMTTTTTFLSVETVAQYLKAISNI